ncbi:MAG TPA: TIGR02281 family clan AA aspartic protease [Burkholderiaceae bacterium]|nr:TIGR02281 family clan AA aspartic protease [Burkholderiaceae bacterium]
MAVSRRRVERLGCAARLVGVVLAATLAAGAAAAQAVAMTGSMGSKALLVIDGKTVTVGAGSTVQGIKVISVQGDQTVVEVNGERQTLRLGVAQVTASGPAGGGRQIVLTAGDGGHFQTLGAINGRTVTFMVDTGATTISMSSTDADRIGLKYQQGQPIGLQTANGVVRGWRVSLGSVRIGDVEVFNVDGVVANREMPFVLLGNSFLSRFQMKRENDQMTLERRF